MPSGLFSVCQLSVSRLSVAAVAGVIHRSHDGVRSCGRDLRGTSAVVSRTVGNGGCLERLAPAVIVEI